MTLNELFLTKTCPCCDKEFILRSYEWVYRLYDKYGNRIWYCSYTCYMKMKREREANKRKKINCIKNYVVGVNHMILEGKTYQKIRQHIIQVEAMSKTEARKLAVKEVKINRGWLEADWCKEVKREKIQN